ncbi:hypothetical protein FKM82_008336 [Ascaphus truei]
MQLVKRERDRHREGTERHAERLLRTRRDMQRDCSVHAETCRDCSVHAETCRETAHLWSLTLHTTLTPHSPLTPRMKAILIAVIHILVL